MLGFSTVDGFVEISDSLAEMIKYVANEPSVGLFFIQQHTQNAVPNVVKLKNDVTEKSHETILHTEDLEDSLTMVRSMKECGFPIADEMIGDIKKSVLTMSTKQPKRGLIHRSASNFQTEIASFWSNSSASEQEGSEKRSNYFSSVFKFSKQKSSICSQLDSVGSIDSKTENPHQNHSMPLSVTSATATSSLQGMEPNVSPLSRQVEDESPPVQSDISDLGNKLLSVSEKYEDFKANKEAKLEEWLEGTRT